MESDYAGREAQNLAFPIVLFTGSDRNRIVEPLREMRDEFAKARTQPTRNVSCSIKSESLHRIVPLGERHLRTAIREYVEHYHLERNHQGLETKGDAAFESIDINRSGYIDFDKFLRSVYTALEQVAP